MKQIKTHYTSRKISFLEYCTSENWIEDFPHQNWCLIIIAEERQPQYFQEIIRKSIDRDVGYVVAIGQQHELIHDLADQEIAFRDSDIEDHHLPDHTIMTVGDSNFEEGLWFGLNLTYNDGSTINEIVILDLTSQAYDKTIELINKFETGYLPPD